jgi:hypothetical protein
MKQTTPDVKYQMYQASMTLNSVQFSTTLSAHHSVQLSRLIGPVRRLKDEQTKTSMSIRSLSRTDMVLENSIYSSFNNLTWQVSRHGVIVLYSGQNIPEFCLIRCPLHHHTDRPTGVISGSLVTAAEVKCYELLHSDLSHLLSFISSRVYSALLTVCDVRTAV